MLSTLHKNILWDNTPTQIHGVLMVPWIKKPLLICHCPLPRPTSLADSRCCRPRPAAERSRRESWAGWSWYLDRYGSSLLLLLQQVAENYLPLPLPPFAHIHRAHTEPLLRRESSRHCFRNHSVESLCMQLRLHRKRARLQPNTGSFRWRT